MRVAAQICSTNCSSSSAVISSTRRVAQLRSSALTTSLITSVHAVSGCNRIHINPGSNVRERSAYALTVGPASDSVLSWLEKVLRLRCQDDRTARSEGTGLAFCTSSFNTVIDSIRTLLLFYQRENCFVTIAIAHVSVTSSDCIVLIAARKSSVPVARNC